MVCLATQSTHAVLFVDSVYPNPPHTQSQSELSQQDIRFLIFNGRILHRPIAMLTLGILSTWSWRGTGLFKTSYGMGKVSAEEVL